MKPKNGFLEPARRQWMLLGMAVWKSLLNASLLCGLALAISFGLTGCPQSYVVHTLEVTVDSLNFPSSGGTGTIGIKTNVGWSVGSVVKDWLTLTPASGNKNAEVTVTATANPGTSTRSATITVNGTDVPGKTVKVTQEGALPSSFLSLSTSSLTFSAINEGFHETFSINSNINWMVACSKSWLTASPSSGSNNGTVIVTAENNPDKSDRSATITVSGTNVATQTISVTQKGAGAYLFLSTHSFTFTSQAGAQSLNIYSNADWSLTSSAAWLTVSPASDSNDRTVTVSVTANPGPTERKATLTITGPEFAEPIILWVTQSE